MFWLLFIAWVTLLMVPTPRFISKELLLLVGLFAIVTNPPS